MKMYGTYRKRSHMDQEQYTSQGFRRDKSESIVSCLKKQKDGALAYQRIAKRIQPATSYNKLLTWQRQTRMRTGEPKVKQFIYVG